MDKDVILLVNRWIMDVFTFAGVDPSEDQSEGVEVAQEMQVLKVRSCARWLMLGHRIH